MIKIAVVEDDINMHQIIKQYLMEIKNNIEITVFESAEIFLEELARGEKYQVALCDIEMPGMSGIELGKILQKDFSEIILIYLIIKREFPV